MLHNFQQKAEQSMAPEECQYCSLGLTDGDEEKEQAYNKEQAFISIDIQRLCSQECQEL